MTTASAQVDPKPTLTAMGRLPKDQVRKEMPMLPLVLSSDSHVFEPPDLWQTRIDADFRDRAPRIERIDGGRLMALLLRGRSLTTPPSLGIECNGPK